MADDNIAFLKEFIGPEWLHAEFKKIDTKSPLKGAGVHFATYHPWVQFMYEIDYLTRRADLEKSDNIIMGRYHYILDNAGLLLKENIKYITNTKDAKQKLRSPKEFYDYIWELETRTMLVSSGASATFVVPENGNTYDGIATVSDRPIAFECKNKVLDNERYNTNSIFAQILTNRLSDIESVRNKILQIEFENGRFEDIKTIVAIVRDKVDISNYLYILERYRVLVLKNIPFKAPCEYLIQLDGISSVVEINEEKKGEIYLEHAPSKTVKAKLLFKMPDRVYKLNNINGVLRKANSQLSAGGIVFLKVPYSTFTSAKNEIKEELMRHFPNIYAVKLVALDENYIENKGVKVSRLEELVLSTQAKNRLTQYEINFFSKQMAFAKYANVPLSNR